MIERNILVVSPSQVEICTHDKWTSMNFNEGKCKSGERHSRAGAGYTGFDYGKMKDLPPLPEEGARKLEEMWSNITYFLKAVIPVAEKSGVRLALHPNDPPAPSVGRNRRRAPG